MKIQLVFNHRDRLADPSMSIRYERYIEGFRGLGHDVPMITTVASAEGVNWAETVPDTRSLFDPLLWARLSPDLVLIPDVARDGRPVGRHPPARPPCDCPGRQRRIRRLPRPPLAVALPEVGDGAVT